MTPARTLPAALATLFALCLPATAQPDPSPDLGLTVDHPFATAIARNNLALCAPDLATADIDNLTRIASLGYAFTPPGGGTGQDGGFPVTATRTLAIDLAELAPAAILASLARLERDGCEETLRIKDGTVAIPDKDHVALGFRVAVDLFTCGTFLGIPYKQSVGDGTADIAITYRVDQNAAITVQGTPAVTNVRTHDDTLFSILTLFSPSGSFLRSVVDTVVSLQLKSMAASTHITEFAIGSDQFRVFSAGMKSVAAYTGALDLVGSLAWVLDTDPARSGLVPGKLDPPRYELVQTKAYDAFFGNLAYTVRKAEIAYIRDLAIPKPRFVTVEPGDSLWRIARRHYLDPRITLHIEDLNGLRGRHLRPGTQLRLPLLYEVCQQVVGNDALVRPEDTLTAIGARHHRPYHPPPVTLRSGNPNLIYPYEAIR